MATAAVAALAVSLILVRPIRWLALRLDLTDRPAAHKVHRRATPYLGGAVVMMAALPVAALLSGSWPPPLLMLCVAALGVGILGLVDDIRPLSPLVRLAVETLAAAAFVATGVHARVSGVEWIDSILTVAWIVLLTNSFNLLDNSDAALACVTVATAGVLALAAVLQGLPYLAILLASVAGATLGFGTKNWPPARMFLGDAGSLFIGFLLCGAAVWIIAGLPSRSGVAAWLLLVVLPAAADTTVVVISRLRAGRSITQGGADHIAHRLTRLGLRKAVVALILGGSAICACLVGLAVLTGRLSGLIALAAATLAVLTSAIVALRARNADIADSAHFTLTPRQPEPTIAARPVPGPPERGPWKAPRSMADLP